MKMILLLIACTVSCNGMESQLPANSIDQDRASSSGARGIAIMSSHIDAKLGSTYFRDKFMAALDGYNNSEALNDQNPQEQFFLSEQTLHDVRDVLEIGLELIDARKKIVVQTQNKLRGVIAKPRSCLVTGAWLAECLEYELKDEEDLKAAEEAIKEDLQKIKAKANTGGD